MKVLFRIAAGPRIGFGHLRRAVTLSRALGTRPLVSIRGGGHAHRAARRLECRPVQGPAGRALDRERPAVLVIDDPNASMAGVWLEAARARAIPVASVHDLGIAWIASDLLVDGSFAQGRRARAKTIAQRIPVSRPRMLLGPRYMPLDPRLARRPGGTRGRSPRILIALGGGPRRHHAQTLARAILAACPDAVVRIAGGFTQSHGEESGIVWLPGLPSLGGELSAATIAVVAGGVTLYEACRLGVPSVAVAVSTLSAQRHTVRAGRSLGVTLDGGALGEPATPRRVASLVERLLDGPKRRASLGSRGARLVDGRGAERVARELRELARKKQ